MKTNKKEEGVIKLILQGAMGQVLNLILPTKDIENCNKNLENIKEAYGYCDYKILGSEIIRGKILH